MRVSPFFGHAAPICALGAAAALLLAEPARAQCSSAPVSIQVTTTGTFANNCTLNALTNRWDISVTINGPVTSNSTVTIRGASTLMLGKVTIQNNSAIDCRVNILGSGFDQRIGGVGFIDKGTSAANRVLLLQLDTVGDVGYDRPGAAAIRTDMISNLSIGGNVLGTLVSEGVSRHMQNSYIQGDLRGGISLGPTSSLDWLWIGGNLGMPTDDPVRVYVSGNLKNLTAGAINADITTLANGAAGTVHAIDVTTGSFKGSLTAHRMGFLADGAGPAMFNVAGDLDASFTITRDMRVPFSVGGTYRQSRLIAGNAVPNVFSAGTGLFDDAGAAPGSAMVIQGNLAAEMNLGTPLSAGLASINRELFVGGSFTGAISMQQDAGAPITVTGPFAGRLNIAGSHRAGYAITCVSPMAGAISVGGGLLGALSVPTGGLQGQVIINASNGVGIWGGPILIGGSNMLSPQPHYAAKSANFGGGAVGVVPFRAHLEDCTPVHDDGGPDGFALVQQFADSSNTPVVFRAYGPVQPSAGASVKQCIAIEQQVGLAWVDRSALFNAAVVGAPAPTVAGRAIALSGSGGGLPPAGRYRIRNVCMQCASVTGTPPLAWTEPYLFRIDNDCDDNGQGDAAEIAAAPSLDGNSDGVLDRCQSPGCPCDFNDSGVLSVQDVFDFLGAYFTASPLADVNMSGSVTIQDIFDFLNCYFGRPPGC